MKETHVQLYIHKNLRLFFISFEKWLYSFYKDFSKLTGEFEPFPTLLQRRLGLSKTYNLHASERLPESKLILGPKNFNTGFTSQNWILENGLWPKWQDYNINHENFLLFNLLSPLHPSILKTSQPFSVMR